MSQKNIFFIRGFTRSGTNWVNNILNLHPEIYATGEFNFIPITRGLEFVRNREWGVLSTKENKKYSDIARTEYEEMVRNTILKCCEEEAPPTAHWYGDRSPNPLVPFPVRAGYYIWIIRDVRDVIVSLTFHTLNQDHEESVFAAFPKMKEKQALFREHPTYFDTHPQQLLDDTDWVMHITHNWHNQTKLNIRAIEAQQQKKHGAHIHVVTYEQLHSNIESERKKMYAFLSLDPTKAAPLSSLTQPGFTTERPNNHYRAGQTQSWKKYMSPETEAHVVAIAQESLEYFSYEH